MSFKQQAIKLQDDINAGIGDRYTWANRAEDLGMDDVADAFRSGIGSSIREGHRFLAEEIEAN